jgi:hypothetical protein
MSLKARPPCDLKNRAHLRQIDAAWQQLQQEQEEDRKHEDWQITEAEIEEMANDYFVQEAAADQAAEDEWTYQQEIKL